MEETEAVTETDPKAYLLVRLSTPQEDCLQRTRLAEAIVEPHHDPSKEPNGISQVLPRDYGFVTVPHPDQTFCSMRFLIHRFRHDAHPNH